MTEVDKLLIVQGHDLKLREYERELKDIPDRKVKEETVLETNRRAVADAETSLKTAQSESKNLDVEVESFKEKINKLRTQQFQIKTNKEFKALEDEIKVYSEKIVSLEDRELVLMQVIEDRTAALAAAKVALVKKQEEVDSLKKQLDVRADSVRAELEGQRAMRSQAASLVDSAWLAEYDRILTRKEPALVPLEDENCGGCHLKVTPSIVHTAKARMEIVTCNYCGRLVYL